MQICDIKLALFAPNFEKQTHGRHKGCLFAKAGSAAADVTNPSMGTAWTVSQLEGGAARRFKKSLDLEKSHMTMQLEILCSDDLGTWFLLHSDLAHRLIVESG